MVTAKDINISLTDLSKEGGKFLVGDMVGGQLKIKVPGKLAVWRIELKMGDQKLTVANDQVLKRGINFIPFSFPKPLDNFDYKKGSFRIDHNLEVKLFPSRIKNELSGDRYLREFGGATYGLSTAGFKQKSFHFSVLRGDARYKIPARQLLLNGKDRSWWLILLAILFGSSMLIPVDNPIPLIVLLAFLPILYLLEGDYLGRHLFGHLLAEIRTDHKGYPHLHLEPRGAGEEFLDARIRLQIKAVLGVGDDISTTKLFDKSVSIRNHATRIGKHFRVPLPFPPGDLPASYSHQLQRIEWVFYLEYYRKWGKNIKFRIPVKVGLAQPDQIPLPEEDDALDDVLELVPLREKQLNRQENDR